MFNFLGEGVLMVLLLFLFLFFFESFQKTVKNPRPSTEEFEDLEIAGITPLYLAAAWGYPELVNYLLEKQAKERSAVECLWPSRVFFVALFKFRGYLQPKVAL